MSESSLKKLQALRTSTLLKRDFITGLLPENFLNYLKAPILQRIYERLVLEHQCSFMRNLFLKNFSSGFFWQFQVSRLQLYSSKEILAKMFVCEFYKIFKNIFRQSTSGWLHLWILRSFSDHLLYRAPLRNCLFHAKVAGFQPQNTIQNISQVLFKHFIQKQEVAIPRRSFT